MLVWMLIGYVVETLLMATCVFVGAYEGLGEFIDDLLEGYSRVLRFAWFVYYILVFIVVASVFALVWPATMIWCIIRIIREV